MKFRRFVLLTLDGDDVEIDVVIDGKKHHIRKDKFSGRIDDYQIQLTREEIDQAIKKSEKLGENYD